MKAIRVISALAVSNFIAAYILTGNYDAAFERSFFQAAAVLIYVVFNL